MVELLTKFSNVADAHDDLATQVDVIWKVLHERHQEVDAPLHSDFGLEYA